MALIFIFSRWYSKNLTFGGGRLLPPCYAIGVGLKSPFWESFQIRCLSAVSAGFGLLECLKKNKKLTFFSFLWCYVKNLNWLDDKKSNTIRIIGTMALNACIKEKKKISKMKTWWGDSHCKRKQDDQEKSDQIHFYQMLFFNLPPDISVNERKQQRG